MAWNRNRPPAESGDDDGGDGMTPDDAASLRIGKQVRGAIDFAMTNTTQTQIQVDDPDHGLTYVAIKLWTGRR